MNQTMCLGRTERLQIASQLIADMPAPNYEANFQVPYGRVDLLEAMAENLTNRGVASVEDIGGLKTLLGEIATGKSSRPVVITNGCAEKIDVNEPIGEIAQRTTDEIKTVKGSQLKDPVIIQRIGGQFFKPRSSMFDGDALSYMGDGINGKDKAKRLPDASRLVAGAIQSMDLQERLTRQQDNEAVLMAHEALSFAYELPFLRPAGDSGIRQHLVSAHLPWIGLRTNSVDGPHVNLLSRVENPVGVKISGKSNHEHISGLAKKLDPASEAGKLVFMIRTTDSEDQTGILRAIKKHAPEAIVLYDIHGSTANINGYKIRHIGNIASQIERLAINCGRAGLRLHGLHLETMGIRVGLNVLITTASYLHPVI